MKQLILTLKLIKNINSEERKNEFKKYFKKKKLCQGTPQEELIYT